MAPVIHKLSQNKNFLVKVCITGQHKEMLKQVLDVFEINPDFDFQIMKPAQTLSEISSNILAKASEIMIKFQPDIILVHGDTSSSIILALSAYYNQIKIAHIEAGLRTGNIYSPWPEEGNRKLTAAISNFHFSPTEESKKNLIKENVNQKTIYVTGNTVIDALFLANKKLLNDATLYRNIEKSFPFLNNKKKMILVTGHRRENFGKGFEEICSAIRDLALKNSNVQIVYPVHLNPNVQRPVKEKLLGFDNIFLIEPQEYLPFVYLMSRSFIVLTDSGGIQEEAPSIGKPVLVMRDTTERPEALLAGTVKLVGTNSKNISESVQQLLDDEDLYIRMTSSKNPYGDGNASQKINDILEEVL